MSFFETITIAVFGLGLVFLILVALSVIIGIQSRILSSFAGKKKALPEERQDLANDNEYEEIDEDSVITAGELKLYDVDDKTAAMIMAIVSDESKIPLSELIFKSIKALD